MALSSLTLIGLAQLWPGALLGFAVLGPLIALGAVDILQQPHAIRRNFPIIGHGRYLL